MSQPTGSAPSSLRVRLTQSPSDFLSNVTTTFLGQVSLSDACPPTLTVLTIPPPVEWWNATRTSAGVRLSYTSPSDPAKPFGKDRFFLLTPFGTFAFAGSSPP